MYLKSRLCFTKLVVISKSHEGISQLRCFGLPYGSRALSFVGVRPPKGSLVDALLP